MRPPGYEPGELPTAPLRDVLFFAAMSFLNCECKITVFYWNMQIIRLLFMYLLKIFLRKH